jgi:hypothetical protein
MNIELKDCHYGFNNVLFYSSFVFITNIILAHYIHDPIYFLLFSLLLASSLIVHYTQNIFAYYCDKVFIYSVVAYGFLVFSMKLYKINTHYQMLLALIVVFCFVVCIYIYDNYSHISLVLLNKEGYFYHVLVHLAGSIGHNLIMLL